MTFLDRLGEVLLDFVDDHFPGIFVLILLALLGIVLYGVLS